MARGNQSKSVKANVSAADLAELNTMFDQLTGTSDADRDIIVPKLCKLHEIVCRVHQLVRILVGLSDLKIALENNGVDSWLVEFEAYSAALAEETKTNVDAGAKFYAVGGGAGASVNAGANAETYAAQLESVETPVVNKMYREIKDGEKFRQIIITCGNLASFKKSISDKNALDVRFVDREPGLSLTPFSFSELDLKMLWSFDELPQKAREFIVTVLHHMYTIGVEAYNVVSSPDIDVGRFSHILVDNISGLRRELPRCDKAFDIIENSVKMLEDNFTSYYKQSVEADNPSLIVESFIGDIARSTKSTSIVVAAQFKRIVDYLQNKASGMKTHDPRLRRMLNMMNSQMDQIPSVRPST